MTFLSPWNWLKPRQRHFAVRPRRHRHHDHNLRARTVLRLEALEDRMVPSQNGYIQTNLVSDLASGRLAIASGLETCLLPQVA